MFGMLPAGMTAGAFNKIFTGFGESYSLGWGNYRGDRIGIYSFNQESEQGHIDVDQFSYEF